MEDAATAEISRSQLWQWIHRGVITEEGTRVTHAHVERLLEGLLESVERSESDRFDEAAAIFREVTLREDFPTFLTISAYSRYLVDGAESVERPPKPVAVSV